MNANEKQVVGNIVSVGNIMASMLYNLSICASLNATEFERKRMKTVYELWDAALERLPKSRKGAAIAEAGRGSEQ